MKRLYTGLSSIQSSHDEDVVALFGSQQLHFSIETICDAVFGAVDDLCHEEICVEIWYFFVYVSCMQFA